MEPESVDVTEGLTEGAHTVSFDIEDVRPRVDDHDGYWRVSAYLAGWEE